MEATPGVSVVIPTRARPGLVVRCVAAVLDDSATSEVIVVIDGDDPGTEAALLPVARDDRRVRVVHADSVSGGRLGEQRIRDHGARLAAFPVVLALDDDIVAEPGMVTGHARRHAGAADLVVLGHMPVAQPAPGRRWSAATRLYADGYELACERFDDDPGSILLGLWGGNFSVRREHWLRALEDEPAASSAMHTDREFGLRLRRLGLKGIFDRGLRATHHDERDVRRLARDASGSALANIGLERAYPEIAPSDAPARLARRLVAAVAVVTPRMLWRPMLELLMRVVELARERELEASERAATRLVWRLVYERTLKEAHRSAAPGRPA